MTNSNIQGATDLQPILQSLWSIEQQLTEALPSLMKKANSVGLKKSIALHLAETDQHRVAIEMMCLQFGFSAQGAENTELKGILEEGNSSTAGSLAGEEMDAAIIAGAIKVEEYEMQAYQQAANRAETLGLVPIVQRLRLTYEEERQTRTKLLFLLSSLNVAYEQPIANR